MKGWVNRIEDKNNKVKKWSNVRFLKTRQSFLQTEWRKNKKNKQTTKQNKKQQIEKQQTLKEEKCYEWNSIQ